MAALLVTVMLSACATSGAPRLAVNLPPAPGFAKPVSPPPFQSRSDATEFAPACLAKLSAANWTIASFKDWYGGVREGFAKAGGGKNG